MRIKLQLACRHLEGRDYNSPKNREFSKFSIRYFFLNILGVKQLPEAGILLHKRECIRVSASDSQP